MTRATGLGSLTRAYGEPLRHPLGAPRILERPMPDLSAGRCASHPDPDLWFDTPHPTTGEFSRVGKQRVEAAKAICHTCPLEDPCALWAIQYGEPHGVYGGLDPAERDVLRRNRRFPRRI